MGGGRLSCRYGRDECEALLATIAATAEQFAAAGGGDEAAELIRADHPTITDRALAALAWCYRYDHRVDDP